MNCRHAVHLVSYIISKTSRFGDLFVCLCVLVLNTFYFAHLIRITGDALGERDGVHGRSKDGGGARCFRRVSAGRAKTLPSGTGPTVCKILPFTTTTTFDDISDSRHVGLWGKKNKYYTARICKQTYYRVM